MAQFRWHELADRPGSGAVNRWQQRWATALSASRCQSGALGSGLRGVAGADRPEASLNAGLEFFAFSTCQWSDALVARPSVGSGSRLAHTLSAETA